MNGTQLDEDVIVQKLADRMAEGGEPPDEAQRERDHERARWIMWLVAAADCRVVAL